MTNKSDGYPCPYCQEKPLETTATAPYVRGMIVAYLVGSKTFIGCCDCVGKKMRGEAGVSLLIGWFSLVSAVLNPFMILYNFFGSFFVKPKPAAVAKKIKQLGLPDSPNIVNVQSVGMALAAAMILADGVVEEAELEAAEKAGDEVFGEFDEAALRMIVQHGKDLPPVEDLAGMIRDVLDQEQKEKVIVYLAEIAMSDGHVAPEERLMLEKVGQCLGVTSPMSA